MAGKLILCRHGQSEWNLSNRFTGWEDVDLTEKGEKEAKDAGYNLAKENISFDAAYTSLLKRATRTLFIILEEMNLTWIPITNAWELNERHYGALQGLNKSEVAKEYGEEQVQIWRRSYDIPPPLLLEDDEKHPKLNEKFKNINGDLPVGESLKNVIDRLKPFWKEYVNNITQNGGNHLIVAHSNSLRAIVKILDQLSDEEIISVNIPTGVPLVYELDDQLSPIKHYYLGDQDAIDKKASEVAAQGKAK